MKKLWLACSLIALVCLSPKAIFAAPITKVATQSLEVDFTLNGQLTGNDMTSNTLIVNGIAPKQTDYYQLLKEDAFVTVGKDKVAVLSDKFTMDANSNRAIRFDETLAPVDKAKLVTNTLTQRVRFDTIYYNVDTNAFSNKTITDDSLLLQTTETVNLPTTNASMQQAAADIKALVTNKENAIEYIAETFRYVYDHVTAPEKPLLARDYLNKGAVNALALGIGSAKDYAELSATLLRANGIPTRVVTGMTTKPTTLAKTGTFDITKDVHYWTEVYVNGHGWMLIDPSIETRILPLREKTLPNGKNIRVAFYPSSVFTEKEELYKRTFRSMQDYVYYPYMYTMTTNSTCTKSSFFTNCAKQSGNKFALVPAKDSPTNAAFLKEIASITFDAAIFTTLPFDTPTALTGTVTYYNGTTKKFSADQLPEVEFRSSMPSAISIVQNKLVLQKPPVRWMFCYISASLKHNNRLLGSYHVPIEIKTSIANKVTVTTLAPQTYDMRFYYNRVAYVPSTTLPIKSSNENVFKMIDLHTGQLTGKKGSADIYYEQFGKKIPIQTVTVSPTITVKNPIRFSLTPIDVTPSVTYSSAWKNVAVTGKWETSNPAVVTIDDQHMLRFTGKEGKYTVTFKTDLGVNYTYSSTVTVAKSVTLGQYATQGFKLVANFTYPNKAAVDGETSFTSSDTTIATVDNNGNVTLLGKPGRVTFTAKRGDFTATYSYTVTGTLSANMKKITKSTTPTTLETKFTYGDKRFTQVVKPTYTSSNPAVATVDENGLVTFTGRYGQGTITATYNGLKLSIPFETGGQLKVEVVDNKLQSYIVLADGTIDRTAAIKYTTNRSEVKIINGEIVMTKPVDTYTITATFGTLRATFVKK